MVYNQSKGATIFGLFDLFQKGIGAFMDEKKSLLQPVLRSQSFFLGELKPKLKFKGGPGLAQTSPKKVSINTLNISKLKINTHGAGSGVRARSRPKTDRLRNTGYNPIIKLYSTYLKGQC